MTGQTTASKRIIEGIFIAVVAGLILWWITDQGLRKNPVAHNADTSIDPKPRQENTKQPEDGTGVTRKVSSHQSVPDATLTQNQTKENSTASPDPNATSDPYLDRISVYVGLDNLTSETMMVRIGNYPNPFEAPPAIGPFNLPWMNRSHSLAISMTPRWYKHVMSNDDSVALVSLKDGRDCKSPVPIQLLHTSDTAANGMIRTLVTGSVTQAALEQCLHGN